MTNRAVPMWLPGIVPQEMFLVNSRIMSLKVDSMKVLAVVDVKEVDVDAKRHVYQNWYLVN